MNAKVNLKPSELEIERFDLARKNDSLSGEGKIDVSPEHNYSGTLDAWTDDLRDYISTLRGSPGQNAGPIPAELQATINSSKWETRGVIHLPKSSPVSFTANFALPIGTTWSAFQLSPLKISLDFPAMFLATAPNLFHSDILKDGILSGNISLSETLQHPRIVGDVQLVNGKLSSRSESLVNAKEASGRIIFDESHASLEFLNLATKDVDLSVRGEIDFESTNDVTIKIVGATPIFDFMAAPIDCVNQIEIMPAALPLAPAATELEFRGSLFRSGWSVSLNDEIGNHLASAGTPATAAREFPLCFGTGPEEKTLLLGAVPRAEAGRQTEPKKRQKRR